MKTAILFRKDSDNEEEFKVAESCLSTYSSRCAIPQDTLVVGRYSVLPYYKELDNDLVLNGSRLINSYSEHCWIADMQQWYSYFEDLTPKTWFSLFDASKENGPFVLKGQTNSKKFEWDTHMYAADRTALPEVYCRLQNDSLVGQQSIYIRQYVPLKKVSTGLRGLPITNEYRTFFLDGEPLVTAYYWSSHSDELSGQERKPPESFIKEIGSRIKARFVVADIAETESGDWILIELNDGQMSGLSECSAVELYTALAKKLGA